ncbi:alpha/beta hydrolase [Xanthocytophaga flava]|uniref:alpha/beta hydrolase n=1 Tax=Xanthocytophaga flava TaxID=3048013 RepID=UPI0028D1393C|nr:alpha/beta hydrolase [Xanthocytophaga flavus]MDJ1467584.1 alpha/beta hydrolase [Xanthocytophaga flavus]
MKNLFLFSFMLVCNWAYSQAITTYSVSELKDIPYYQGAGYDSANHKLNLVLPRGVKNPPLLIWIGGGAWSYVNRNMEMDIGRKFAQKGIAVASVGHRLSPATWKDSSLNKGIRHPEHSIDIARAVKYLYANASKYGYSLNKIFVSGYSSGGHLAALIAMDNQYLKNEGLSKNIFKGVIPIAGAYDVLHYYQVLAKSNGSSFADNHIGSVFGPTIQDFEKGSPTSYIDSLSTPMLLISETNTFKYADLFETRLREKEYNKLEVLHIHRLKHGELWKELSYSPHSIYREVIEDFIKRNSGIVPSPTQ